VFQTIVQPSSSGSGLKEIMKMKTLQSLEVLWTTELTAQRNILESSATPWQEYRIFHATNPFSLPD
jgi:hypothetical protein